MSASVTRIRNEPGADRRATFLEIGKRSAVAVGLRAAECDAIRNCLYPCLVDVLAVPSVENAIEQSACDPRLVFCDTGSEWRATLARFIERWPGVRVVFLSRIFDNRMWLDMLEAGAYDLLVRPVRLVEIHWIARGALIGAGTVSAAHR